MGCDIHLFVEKLDQERKWQIVAPPVGEKSYRYDSPRDVKCGLAYVEGEEDTTDAPSRIPPSLKCWFDSRNYSLFSILANVRNGSDIPYLSRPRGVPFDACAAYGLEVSAVGDYAHSHSYFTLYELKHMLAYISSVPTHGVVRAMHVIESGLIPDNFCSWSKSVFGGGVKIVSQDEFLAMNEAERYDFAAAGSSYVDWHWNRPLEVVISEFNDMVQEIVDTNPESFLADLRIVFYFDN